LLLIVMCIFFIWDISAKSHYHPVLSCAITNNIQQAIIRTERYYIDDTG